MRIIEVTFEKGYPPKLIGRPPNWENDQPLFIDEDAELPVELFHWLKILKLSSKISIMPGGDTI